MYQGRMEYVKRVLGEDIDVTTHGESRIPDKYAVLNMPVMPLGWLAVIGCEAERKIYGK